MEDLIFKVGDKVLFKKEYIATRNRVSDDTSLFKGAWEDVHTITKMTHRDTLMYLDDASQGGWYTKRFIKAEGSIIDQQSGRRVTYDDV